MNAIWERDAVPRDWVEGWVRTELRDLDRPVTAAEFDRLMKPPDPQEAQARQFAALLSG